MPPAPCLHPLARCSRFKAAPIPRGPTLSTRASPHFPPQLALALRSEVAALEGAGCRIVQARLGRSRSAARRLLTCRVHAPLGPPPALIVCTRAQGPRGRDRARPLPLLPPSPPHSRPSACAPGGRARAARGAAPEGRQVGLIPVMGGRRVQVGGGGHAHIHGLRAHARCKQTRERGLAPRRAGRWPTPTPTCAAAPRAGWPRPSRRPRRRS